MTKREAIKLAQRVEAWQKRLAPLGIGHFRILAVHVVDQTPGGARANASVFTPSDYDSAEFWFKYDYVEECNEQELDETIIHEWLHVAFRDLDDALEVVESWMPEATHNDFENRIDHEREGVIDRLARLIYALHNKT